MIELTIFKFLLADLKRTKETNKEFYKNTQNNKSPNHSVIVKHNVVGTCPFSHLKVWSSSLFGIVLG
jgi:hypothetical protein